MTWVCGSLGLRDERPPTIIATPNHRMDIACKTRSGFGFTAIMGASVLVRVQEKKQVELSLAITLRDNFQVDSSGKMRSHVTGRKNGWNPQSGHASGLQAFACWIPQDQFVGSSGLPYKEGQSTWRAPRRGSGWLWHCSRVNRYWPHTSFLKDTSI